MRSRKFAVVAAALSVAIVASAVAAVAFAAAPTTSVLIDATVRPNTAGTASNPRNVALNIKVGTRNSDGSVPPVVSRALVSLDRNLVFAPAGWPSCTPREILNARTRRQCDAKGAKVGTGSAVGQLPPSTRVNLRVTAYDGPGSTQFLLHVVASSPSINAVLVGRLQPGRGLYGRVLNVTVPEELQSPAPNVFASLTDFSTNISAAARPIREGRRTVRMSYVRLKGCTRGRLNFKYETIFRRSGGPPAPPSGRASQTESYPCRSR